MFNLIEKVYAAPASIQIPTLTFASGTPSIQAIIANIVNWVFWLAGAVAIVYLIYGGILYITAGGDAEKATKGRTALINAIIGILIIVSAIVIINLVKGFAAKPTTF